MKTVVCFFFLSNEKRNREDYLSLISYCLLTFLLTMENCKTELQLAIWCEVQLHDCTNPRACM